MASSEISSGGFGSLHCWLLGLASSTRDTVQHYSSSFNAGLNLKHHEAHQLLFLKFSRCSMTIGSFSRRARRMFADKVFLVSCHWGARMPSPPRWW